MAGLGQNTRFFRSEPMSLVQLYMPYELARATTSELGELGLVQFRDLNPQVSAFQRRHVQDIRRLDEMDRRIRFLAAQAERANVAVGAPGGGAIASAAAAGAAGAATANYARRQQEMDELDALLIEAEARIVQMNGSQSTFNKKMLELTELGYVLRETAAFFDSNDSRRDEFGAGGADADDTALINDMEANVVGGSSHLGFVAGVIERRKLPAFERILWRALRGNLYLKSADIAEPIIDPATDEPLQKSVICIFAHGRETLDKIKRLAESLGATLYPVDSSLDRRRADAAEVRQRLDDLNQVLFSTNATRRHELQKVADHLPRWRVLVAKEKAVFHSLNLFAADASAAQGGAAPKTLIAEAWCPTEAIPAVQQALTVAKEATRAHVSTVLTVLRTSREPPTYHLRNKVTSGFQEIIDAYGIARYREVNPGLFAVITFPFLFAVMFGDLGHGFLVALAGAYLCWYEDSLRAKARKSEALSMLFGGRYMVLFMGLFSMFTGLVYNDTFSKMISLFPSGWKWEPVSPGSTEYVGKQVGVYPLGVDYAWQLAENKLLFTNSYKMKMSIVLGVLHMTFATFLSLANHIHYKKWINVWHIFIPQVIFMQSIFGYLVVCIIYKWCVDWNAPGANQPPGLLNMLIFMFLSPGNVKPSEQLYRGQPVVQQALVFIALICVPWMLCVKPYLLKRAHNQKIAAGYGVLGGDGAAGHGVIGEDPAHAQTTALAGLDVGPTPGGPGPATAPGGAPAGGHDEHEGGGGGHHAEDGPNFDFGAIVIDQVIHTIEYCLGCISNTASYLRLWALSLAHAQLSEVLWDMTLGGVFAMENAALQPIMLAVLFPLWFGTTIGILIGMEGLSAFLHALRLHWVEFNNKFYEGSGHKFTPFSLAAVVEEVEHGESS